MTPTFAQSGIAGPPGSGPHPPPHAGSALPHHQPLPQTSPVGPPPYGTQLQIQTSQPHPQAQHPQTQQQQQPQQAQQAPYMHQRPQSSHSILTPISAHSQHQHAPPLPPPHVSPATVNQPHQGEYPRQLSQPTTPLGPPLQAGHRQSSCTYTQPTSPHQARVSVPTTNHQMHASQPAHHPGIARMSTSHSLYGSPVAEGHQRSQSMAQCDRGRSMSVSPKTCAPNIPQPQPRPRQQPPPERAATPVKRKLSDVDSVDHPREAQRPAVDMNGAAVPQHLVGRQQRKKRPRMYPKDQPPVWGVDFDENCHLQRHNWSIHSRGPKKKKDAGEEGHPSPPNNSGRQGDRHTAPGAAPNGPGPSSGPPKRPCDASLASLEPLVIGSSKAVADYLFVNVVNSGYAGEMRAHKIAFEIEARLGIVVDRDTQNRVRVPSSVSEVVLDPKLGHWGFKSSLTEVEHAGLNNYLNSLVVETNPRNPQRDPGRLQVKYTHHHDVDFFHELPLQMKEQLPPVIQQHLPENASAKVRISRDHKTNDVLRAIVKVRVENLHIHFPAYPLDCRISVNLEMPWTGPIQVLEGLPIPQDSPMREKNRMSYRQGVIQVDLTQVISKHPPSRNQPVSFFSPPPPPPNSFCFRFA